MDGTTTTFGKQHGVYLSRKVIALITTLFVFGIIATGLLVYNLTSCPSNYPENKYHHEDYHNQTSTKTSDFTTSSIPSPSNTTPEPRKDGEDDEGKLPAKLDVRLPRSIIPKSYHIKIIPFIFEGNFTFHGEVDIVLNVLENSRNVTLHVNDILYDASSISLVSLSDNAKISISNIENDTLKQFLILHLEEEIIRNKLYKLHIKYIGVLNDILQGFYRSSYKMGNQTRWLAATQFQPTDARRAFPCFDEPAMKATFQINLARPTNMTTLSNMPRRRPSTFVEGLSGYVWDYYKESLPMSTYLVAFAVTDFDNLTDGNFSVWARKDAVHQANYSLVIGPKILRHYEDFFQIPFPLPKIDMIALPDFSAGAMENWGLITYRETAMLYQEGVSTSMNLQRVATVIAHELAHQWFGNLVTPTWWSDLWLNEGFATYVEYIGADAVEPKWKILDQFVMQQLQYSFALDALTNSHQISIEVGHPDEINDIFDRISYAKGASVIRMMNHFLTTPVFKRGLTNYLNEKTFSNADQNDLWAALTRQAHKDKIIDVNMSVKEIMDTWTLQTGFPVVTVNRTYPGTLAILTQERFLLLGNASESQSTNWWVPITFTNERENQFDNVRTKCWMKNVPTLVIPDMGASMNEWVIVNIQETGYYRVNYDEENWKMLIGYLMKPKKFKKIGTLNRAQLLDDALNLARAGRLNYQLALNLTRYLIHEKEYVPWQAGFVALSYMGSMFVRTGNYDLFKHFMLVIIKNQYKEIGFDEKPTDAQLTIYKRVDLLYWACTLGQNDCVRNSVNQFQNWRSSPDPDNNNPISPNLKNIVYCTALRVGGQDEWEFAWQRYLNANVGSEKEILMIAMGCSRETWILSRYLSRAITENSGIRKQDAPRVFAAVASNPIGQDLAFNFLRSSWLKIKDYMGTSLSTINSIVRVCTKQRNTAFDVKNLKDFEEEYRNDLGTATRTLKQAIEDAEANVKWMNENYEDIVKWLTSFKKSSSMFTHFLKK